MGKKLRFALCAVFYTALGALGVGLLRTCRALRGLDISTLQYYFNTLKSEFSRKTAAIPEDSGERAVLRDCFLICRLAAIFAVKKRS